MWSDFKTEILICLTNSDRYLKMANCHNREFYAGKCNGAQEIIDVGDRFADGK